MPSKPKPKFDANSWEFTQRMIRLGHNRRVKQYFRDISSDTATNTGREAVKTSLLIRDDDSGIETMNKMLYFSNYLDRDLVLTQADGYQVKKGQDIPQLVVIYRDANSNSVSGNYPIHIPHYNGRRNPKLPTYNKGDYWARWTLKDNSQIIVNAKTEAEAIKVIKILEKHVIKKFRTSENPWLVTGKVAKGTYKQFKAKPVRADFYSEGKSKPFDWREYL